MNGLSGQFHCGRNNQTYQEQSRRSITGHHNAEKRGSWSKGQFTGLSVGLWPLDIEIIGGLWCELWSPLSTGNQSWSASLFSCLFLTYYYFFLLLLLWLFFFVQRATGHVHMYFMIGNYTFLTLFPDLTTNEWMNGIGVYDSLYKPEKKPNRAGGITHTHSTVLYKPRLYEGVKCIITVDNVTLLSVPLSLSFFL